MNYVEGFKIGGVTATQIPCSKGSGVPTTETEGAVGCLYMDTGTGNMYKCTAVNDGVYTWVEVGGGSADGVDAYVIDLVSVGDEIRIASTCNFSFGEMVKAIAADSPIVCRNNSTGREYVLSFIDYNSGQATFVSVGEYGVWTIIINNRCDVSERPYSEFGGGSGGGLSITDDGNGNVTIE